MSTFSLEDLIADYRRMSQSGQGIFAHGAVFDPYAIEQIAFIQHDREGGLGFGDDTILTVNPVAVEYVLAHACDDALAFDTAKTLAGQILVLGDELPDNLAIWLGGALTGKITRPAGRRGKHPSANKKRDAEIVAEIAKCREQGLKATRNSDSKKGGAHSACDVVAARRGMTYPAVEEIWKLHVRRTRERYRKNPWIKTFEEAFLSPGYRLPPRGQA